jgi:CheY-like chemotaxis protein
MVAAGRRGARRVTATPAMHRIPPGRASSGGVSPSASQPKITDSAPSATEALAVARELRPQAVLVDVGLPDRDGIELAQELAGLPWRPRIVLISSDSDTALRVPDGSTGERFAFVPKAQLPNAPLLDLLMGK